MGADAWHFILSCFVVVAYLVWCIYIFEHATFDYYVVEELGSSLDSIKNDGGLWKPSTTRAISLHVLIINILGVIFLYFSGM